QASTKSARLKRVHDTLEKLVTHGPGDVETNASPELVARLRRLSDQRKTLADLDKRIQDARELAAVYSRWMSAVEGRRVEALHLVLRSLSLILAILLVTILIDRGIRRAFGRSSDPRRLHQVRVMATIAVQ